jgi:hypothetical protein
MLKIFIPFFFFEEEEEIKKQFFFYYYKLCCEFVARLLAISVGKLYGFNPTGYLSA